MQGKALQFDQWRIAHLAEFGINSFDNAPSTPAPARTTPSSKVRTPRTPKTKRKDSEREGSERRAKTRRDSEPAPEPDITAENDDSKDDKENTKPNKFGSLFDSLSCGHCGSGFNNLMEYISHKKVCIPDEDFGFAGKKSSEETLDKKADKSSFESNTSISSNTSRTTTSTISSASTDSTQSTDSTMKSCSISSNDTADKKTEVNKKEELIETKDDTIKASDTKDLSVQKTGEEIKRKNSSSLYCDKCDQKFINMVKYEKHRAFCTHSR